MAVLTGGVGCQDKPLIDEDEIEVKTVELGDVHVLYVKKKHTPDGQEPEEESESEEE